LDSHRRTALGLVVLGLFLAVPAFFAYPFLVNPGGNNSPLFAEADLTLAMVFVAAGLAFALRARAKAG
jgi:cbb3-type cytochrome oxidase subunit 3